MPNQNVSDFVWYNLIEEFTQEEGWTSWFCKLYTPYYTKLGSDIDADFRNDEI